MSRSQTVLSHKNSELVDVNEIDHDTNFSNFNKVNEFKKTSDTGEISLSLKMKPI
jgi:hypothetical protein